MNRTPDSLKGIFGRLRGATGRDFAWGFASQGASSATNLGLSILAGRLLGPTALGSIFVGLSYYLLAMGFQRSLISDPLRVGTSSLDEDARRAATDHAFTLVVLGSIAATVLLIALSIALPGNVGHGLALFVPWLVPALVQDFWRSVLFRDRRGAAGALNDGLWLAGMAVTLPLVLIVRTEWVVVANWGVGALVAAITGFFQCRVRWADIKSSARWWKARAWTPRSVARSGVRRLHGGFSTPCIHLGRHLGNSRSGGSTGSPDDVRAAFPARSRSGSSRAASSRSGVHGVGCSGDAPGSSCQRPRAPISGYVPGCCGRPQRPPPRMGIRHLVQRVRRAHHPRRRRPDLRRRRDGLRASVDGAGEREGSSCRSGSRIGVESGPRGRARRHERNSRGSVGHGGGRWTRKSCPSGILDPRMGSRFLDRRGRKRKNGKSRIRLTSGPTRRMVGDVGGNLACHRCAPTAAGRPRGKHPRHAAGSHHCSASASVKAIDHLPIKMGTLRLDASGIPKRVGGPLGGGRGLASPG